MNKKESETKISCISGMSILTYSDIHVHVYVIYISPVFNEAAGWPINQSSDQSLFFFLYYILEIKCF